MKKVLVGILFTIMSVGLLNCCTFKASAPVVKDVFESFELYKQTVMIRSESMTGEEEYVASGFALDNERIVTAGHLCISIWHEQVKGLTKEELNVYYVNNNKEVAKMTGAKIEAMDEKRDICVLHFPKHGIVPLAIAVRNEVKIDDRILMSGSPLGFFPYTAKGRVIASVSKDFGDSDLNDRLVVNVPGAGGVSGGPIINGDGRVIGIVMAKAPFDHVLFAVRAKTIMDFLREEYGK